MCNKSTEEHTILIQFSHGMEVIGRKQYLEMWLKKKKINVIMDCVEPKEALMGKSLLYMGG